jgi:rod shape-determining protein MreD
MIQHRATSRGPVILTLIVGLMLTMMPLPESLDPFRPDWLALLVIFWAMQLPRTWSIGTAWIVGLILDVSQGTLLGQHALAFCVVAFMTVRFHLLMRVFPLPQLSATVFGLLAVYQFLLFWTNGVAGTHAASTVYWGPVVTSALVWPLLFMILSGVRYRDRSAN